MANMANLFSPFMPETCLKIKEKLALDKEVKWEPVEIGENLKVQNNELLFERLQLIAATNQTLDTKKKSNKVKDKEDEDDLSV